MQKRNIETELRESYLEYSLAVIVGRAIPDARDGLKPVHRRILYAQHELSNFYNRPSKKSARIVGDVIGKYHPHGDTAVYDAIVRMAQDFNMRDPLIIGQGNFGSIDGDAPAAMRYTEVRMSKLAQELLADIEKNTVDFRPNYDNTLEEPVVLPAKFPNLLLNGSSGIAVGMATNIPPHNLGELCDAVLYLLDNPQATVNDLLQFVKGPDFPTAGYAFISKGFYDAYREGHGSIKVRGRIQIETRKKNMESIVITEIPYALNKSILVQKIAALVNDRTIEDVTDLRDESDMRGIRIVLDLKRGAASNIIINKLYKYTPLETTFAVNMLAVVDNRPVRLNLLTALTCFLDHRREVVIRRTQFDLEKAKARAHILEGLRIAIDNIDAVIALIRGSQTPDEAKIGLMERFALTEIQAKAILEMRLQRLTGLQREELELEYADILEKITYFTSILADTNVLRSVLKDEITEIKDNYATPRRTEIVAASPEEIEIEDLIPDDDVVITLSRRGYMKRTNLENYQQQKRGGKGIAGLHTAEDDYVQDFIVTSNHQSLCLFTNKGRMYRLKVHQIPEGSRISKGVHIKNILTSLEEAEWIANILALRSFEDDTFFLFLTRNGMVKRSSASLYTNTRSSGVMALGLKEEDELVNVQFVKDENNILLVTANGYSIRFSCTEIRPMGRSAHGVKGIDLRSNDRVVSGVVLSNSDETTEFITVSSLGYGKRTSASLYRKQARGGKGIINFKVTNKTGTVIGASPINNSNQLVLMTSSNKIVRIGVSDIRSRGRIGVGVMLVKLDEGATLVAFDTVDDAGQTEDDKASGTSENESPPFDSENAAESPKSSSAHQGSLFDTENTTENTSTTDEPDATNTAGSTANNSPEDGTSGLV
ncbi:MAG: DNA gyrase subunit A [Desulfovibrionaceae bacterium]|nr:DNA gyrase subunit A [Desulfovibrionaceae bacterium]